MRLICPNCTAQYEVPVEVIPEGGRDVQCSNCGHTWFQPHPDDDAPLVTEDTVAAPEPKDEAGEDDEIDLFADDEFEDEPAEVQTDLPAQRRRSLDPELAEVLREEAERESRARRSEAEALESQPELGLMPPDFDEAERRSRQARERMARIKGEDVPEPRSEPPAPAAEDNASRRDLLPDVDQINQTLRSANERPVETEEGRAPVVQRRKSGGFGRGFLTVLVLAAALSGLYAAAPSLTAAVPALADPLAAYVAAIDAARVWLDGQVTQLLVSMGQIDRAPPTN
ncbi:zinc-ribbon domain-containing protein [Litorisediminicola beolgyonensis]|uniref:Zinc-ribbon domain-containing protein n=1 Tax=Litorisediminicola beolgyonensis TaxID=1173614 RepID=A0ABW3ZDW9_9RHOB